MNCLNCTTCESDCQLKEVDTPSLFCMNCQPSEAPCLKICPNNSADVLNLISLFKDCKNITYVDFSTFKFHYNNRNYSVEHCYHHRLLQL
mgnify:CR=1 FL=1